MGGEFVGLITGGDTDDGEVAYLGAERERLGRIGASGQFFLMVVGEFGDQLADAEKEKVAADIVEGSLVTVLLDEGEGGDEDGVVELDEGFAFEEAVGDGVGLLLVHGEETLVKEGLGGKLCVGA
jgi:hypothetical protein